MPIVNRHLLTEGSDFVNTEASDRIILEQGVETGGAGSASLLPGRWQYQSMFEVFVTVAAPALDKLQPILDIIGPYIPRPARALPTAILAGSFFMPWPVQPPVPRMDSWYQITQTPPKDLRRQQYTYDFFVAPDKQPEPPKLSWVFRQPERIDKLRDIRWTYPSLARPDRRPFDVQFPDKWTPSEEIKAREPVDLSYIPQGEFSGDLLPLVPPAGRFPQVSDGKAREPVDQSYIPQGEFSGDLLPVVMADKWHPIVEKKADDFKDQSYIVPQQYIHWSGVEGDYVGTWHPQIVQPLQLPDRQFQSEFRTDVVVTGAEVVTLDKWYQRASEPRWDARRQLYIYPTFWAPERQPEPRIDTWHPDRPDVLLKARDQRWTYPSVFWPERLPTITLDRWFAETQRPVRRAPSNILLPGTVGVIIPIPPDLDAWAPQVGSPIFVRQRPNFTAEFRTELAITAATPFNWLGSYPDQIARRRSLAYITQGDLILTAAQRPEAVSVDRWFQPIVQPVRRAPGALLYEPSIEPVRIIVPFGWFEPIVQPTFTVRLREFPFGPAPIFIPTPEGAITMDKWYREIIEPKFLRANFNFIFASGSNFFTIVPATGAGNDRLIIVDGRFAIKIGKRTYTFI